MIKNYVIKIALTLTISGASLYATTAKWLDDGEIVNTVEKNISIEKTSNTSKPENKVTLATGETVTLTGGVYVKAKNPQSIVDWANESGYDAVKDRYIKNAVHIKTTAEASIDVANQISKLDGVTTSAPNYRRVLIAK